MDNMSNDPRQDEAEWICDFQKQWSYRTLGVDHPVMIKVKRWARVVAYKFGNPELADDLEQNCLLSLATAKFRADSKLDTFIVTILMNLNRKEWHKRGGDRQKELVDMPDTSSQEVLEAALRHISSERWMKKLVSEQSDVKKIVVSTIMNADKIIGRKRIAEIATEESGKKVTRHQVEVILRQLRESVTTGGSDDSDDDEPQEFERVA
jgi:hypothetical protein